MIAKKIKPSDRANTAQSLLKLLKKRYKHQHKPSPVLIENLLFAVCLEDSNYTIAESSFNYLKNNFHDWNEVRVSSLNELVTAFPHDPHAAERSRRIVEILQYSFDQFYSFELDALKKKTPEQLEKIVNKFSSFSPFMKASTLQLLVGSHTVPLDQSLHNICRFTGLVDYHTTLEQAAEQLKSIFRKAEVMEHLDYMRDLATDKEIHKHLDAGLLHKLTDEEIFDAAVERITNIFNGHYEKKYESKHPQPKAPVETTKQVDNTKSAKKTPLKIKEPEVTKAPPPKAKAATAEKKIPLKAAKSPAKKTTASKKKSDTKKTK